MHPSQTDAVEIKANGPVFVSGPAGTGKSVVAFHRVKWLLRQKGFEDKRVLFTTYTKTLAKYALAMLGKLCTKEELARVDVMTMHSAKGLQFVGVVLALDAWPTIPKNFDTTDAEALEEHMLSERQLLYMAAMRAQRFVLLTSSNGHRADI